MRIRRSEHLEDKAEGLCNGIPYSTETASSEGCSIHFWFGDVTPSDEQLKTVLRTARAHRDVVCASWSPGQPTGFWAHQDMGAKPLIEAAAQASALNTAAP